MNKKYDIVATVGTYTKNGETKNQYKNVGVMMEKDGRPFLLLERTFNPAGMPNAGRGTVLLSLYEPKQKESPQESNYNPAIENPYRTGEIKTSTNFVADLNDEIPF